MTKKKISRTLLLTILFLLLTITSLGCAGSSKKTPGLTRPIKVTAALYPLADLVKQVGGDRVKLTVLAPTARTGKALDQARILIFSGGQIDAWAGQLVSQTKNKDLMIINASDPAAAGLPAAGPRSSIYCWLDPIEAQTIVQAISRALAGLDPAGADFYKKNALHLIVEMANLDWEIRQTLAKAKNKKLPKLDPTWAAFAKRYGLAVAPSQAKQPAQTGAPDQAGLDAFGRSGDPGRATYLDLMRWDLARIIK